MTVNNKALHNNKANHTHTLFVQFDECAQLLAILRPDPEWVQPETRASLQSDSNLWIHMTMAATGT